MKKNSGFTIAELLITMAILAILLVVLIGIINPISLVGKANDSTRKKDLDRIRKSFEEYFNDKGVYPIDVANWNIKDNCEKNLENFTYLRPWPCDPDGEPYYIWVDNDGKSFKILTNLENKTDKVIPVGWYDHDDMFLVNGYTVDQVNYGVSSTNVTWNIFSIGENCTVECYQFSAAGRCNSALSGCTDSTGFGCYRDPSCNSSCRVPCCGAGCN